MLVCYYRGALALKVELITFNHLNVTFSVLLVIIQFVCEDTLFFFNWFKVHKLYILSLEIGCVILFI